MNLYINIINAFILISFINGGLLAQNEAANPFCGGILPATDPIEIGETTIVGFDIGNNGGDPIPAGGAEWTLSFPPTLTVNQSSLDLDGQDAIFSETWFVDASGTYLYLNVIGSGIPEFTPVPPFPFYNISVEVTGQSVGDIPLGANVANDADIAGNTDSGDDNASGALEVITPLPVTLLNFNVIPIDDDTQLTWQTASELNNSHFDLERSLDGKNFEKIGDVKGYGTTSAEQSYEFFDRGIGNEVNGFVYYRLKQVDFDGKFEYSEPRRVLFNGFEDGGFTLFPNPIMGTSKLLIAGSNYGEIVMYNALGQLIAEYDATEAKQRIIDIEALAPGTYYVHSEKGQIEKLIVH